MHTRTIAAACILLLLLAAIAACGRNTEGTNAADTPAASAPSATTSAASAPSAVEPAEEPEQRIVATVNGEVTIPARPQRVVATYYAGELAALGIKPVGTVTRLLGDANPNLAAYTEGVADIGNFPPNLEAITALDPDLIIATDFDNIDFADYAKIAPTVVVPWSNDDVWTKLRTVAKLFGKEAEVEAAVQAYEAKAAEARAAIEGRISEGETVAIFRFFGKSIRVYGGRDIGHAIYNGLRLTPPPIIAETIAQNPNFTSTEDVSLEEIPKYAADRIFVIVTDEDGDRAYREAQRLSVWSGLSAVKNNRVYEIPADKWFTYDPISVRITLDEAVRILTADRAE